VTLTETNSIRALYCRKRGPFCDIYYIALQLENRQITGGYSASEMPKFLQYLFHARADVITPIIGPIYAPDFSPILPGQDSFESA
jgi:hypothetical protein